MIKIQQKPKVSMKSKDTKYFIASCSALLSRLTLRIKP